jgi:lipopolysaccharide export LptBFGC system permease protein LptF
MKNNLKMIIIAIVAVIFTLYGLDTGIGGLLAGYGTAYLIGALLVPILLWVGTLHYYQEYRKENHSAT